MQATWSSPIGGLAAFARKHQEAQKAGLRAAAYVVYNAVKRGLRGGYTSGDFTVGNVINSVTISPVFETLGTFAIRIGTNVPYALYWEVGHNNIFTRRYERVEVWRPAMVDTRDEQAAAFASAYKRSMLS
jgi:hypothetical protein